MYIIASIQESYSRRCAAGACRRKLICTISMNRQTSISIRVSLEPHVAIASPGTANKWSTRAQRRLPTIRWRMQPGRATGCIISHEVVTSGTLANTWSPNIICKTHREIHTQPCFANQPTLYPLCRAIARQQKSWHSHMYRTRLMTPAPGPSEVPSGWIVGWIFRAWPRPELGSLRRMHAIVESAAKRQSCRTHLTWQSSSISMGVIQCRGPCLRMRDLHGCSGDCKGPASLAPWGSSMRRAQGRAATFPCPCKQTMA